MLNQITQLRLPDGQIVALADWTDKPLYASCDMGEGFTNEIIDLFQVSVGRPVPTAASTVGGVITPRQNTLSDTNISTQGGLSSTEEFLVYAIKPEVQEYTYTANNFTTRRYAGAGALANMPAPNLATLAILNSQLLVELEISQKIYSQAGFSWFNTGFGAQASVGYNADALARTNANQGLPSQEAVRTLVIPQHIGGQEKFRLRMRNPSNQAVNFGVSETNPPVVTAIAPDAALRMVTARVYLDGLYKRPVS
jgi:hypothetical protein